MAEELVERTTDEMDLESKRSMDEEDGDYDQNEAASKKQRTDDEKSVEEDRLEAGRVSLGPKSFGSSVEMFDYFYKFLHYWPTNLGINKYEELVLTELLKKGHAEAEKKIGCGVRAFQVRNHPVFKSRCFFILRDDETFDDFSFRKCVDRILPLPEDMKVKFEANKALGGAGKGRGGRGGWRGAKSRA